MVVIIIYTVGTFIARGDEGQPVRVVRGVNHGVSKMHVMSLKDLLSYNTHPVNSNERYSKTTYIVAKNLFSVRSCKVVKQPTEWQVSIEHF